MKTEKKHSIEHITPLWAKVVLCSFVAGVLALSGYALSSEEKIVRSDFVRYFMKKGWSVSGATGVYGSRGNQNSDTIMERARWRGWFEDPPQTTTPTE